MRLTVTPNTLATTKSSVRSSFCAPLVPKPKFQRLKCSSSPSGVEAQPVVWSSHVSRNPNLTSAVEEAVKNALSAALISKSLAANSTPVPLKVTPSQYAAAVQADTALVFCSSSFHEQYQDIIEQLVKAVPSLTRIVGCSGFGVIGGAQSSAEEVEDEPGLSITLAHFPGAEVRVVHISMTDLPDADSPPERWSQLVGAPLHNPLPLSQVILADPSFLRIQELLEGLGFRFRLCVSRCYKNRWIEQLL
ncbi:hypothetical protein CEUSTIGMA_g3136.t1 [Chlamydomonas eustigma]|uniref:FIST domain-containing protein n=1 Tax=Chlamydomonas eustigma TaxID=1157962 RepID=A0A250WXX6_9CHLO|nr:hypothetical protein CEUSTIGMA_g3136.t1 [Chlamydomonas eustigma]|eukprot:GAX75693.1 hypothetical protein CEUSTIGMA_g3136.t1 [Chlamydomonas eustigma]